MRLLEEYERGLRLIASGGCENFTEQSKMWCGDVVDGEPARDGGPYGKFGYNSWCWPCVARASLDGTLPRPVVCIDAEDSKRLAPVATTG